MAIRADRQVGTRGAGGPLPPGGRERPLALRSGICGRRSQAGARDCDAARVRGGEALPDFAGQPWPLHVEAPVKDHTPPEVNVAVDSFVAGRDDRILHALLQGSFALCVSDEIHEAGALVHVQAGRPGRASNPDLTDNTLSTDLLLLDRCLAELRIAEPRARNWQARFVAHADADAGGFDRLSALQAFIEVYLEDTGVALTSAVTHEGMPRQLSFRPAMRTLRCEVISSLDDTCRMQPLPHV